MRLIQSQNRQDTSAATTARESIANDFRLMRAMSGPPILRQAVAGIIHLAFNNPNDWAPHTQARDFAGQFAALRVCRYALSEIHKMLTESADNMRDHHCHEIRGIERAIATPEQTTAFIYWRAMEKLDAAGIDFEQLLSYHYANDDEAEL